MKWNKSTCFLLAGLMTCLNAFAEPPVNITEPAVCYPPQIDWQNYQWVLIGGAKRPVCQEMLRDLQARPKDSPPPVCLHERLPQNINWTRPDWKVLPNEQRESLLKNAPESARKLVSKLREAKEWKLVRIDVTQDDVPETLLAFGGGSADCHKVTRCAVPDGELKGYISITGAAGGNTSLLAMSDDGKHINFMQSRGKPLTTFGELVFYKGQPYWISPLRWDQKVQDDAKGNAASAKQKNNRMFQLAPLKYRNTQNKKMQVNDFKDIFSMLPDPSAACYFGYFHRETQKQD
jgi:hypothetical protein